MGKLWCARWKLRSDIAYLDRRFWDMLTQLELAAHDAVRSGYIKAAAHKYRLECRNAAARLEPVETVIEAVTTYALMRHDDPSIPPI